MSSSLGFGTYGSRTLEIGTVRSDGLRCFRDPHLTDSSPLALCLQVHPDILPYTEESARKKGVRTLAELEQLYNKEVILHTKPEPENVPLCV